MYAEVRQQAIASAIAERGRLSVAAIADEHEVTTETVRRDLTALERAGLVRRVHGGAVAAGSLAMIEAAVAERDLEHAAEKEQIARAALDLLPPEHGSVLLDAGTTTSRLASLIPRDRRLVVFTNAVPIAARLAGRSELELRLLPGRVRTTTQAAVGADTVAALSGLRADVVFLGTNGISASHGLTTPDHDEAATKAAMVDTGTRVVLLADASKVGVETTHRFATPAQLDVLVTDGAVESSERSALERAGIEVQVT